MPIYEYQCQSCKQIIEAWQSLSEEPLSTCSACEGELKKIISQSSFQLKGGGWYADGYSSSSGGAAKGCSASSSCADAAPSPCAGGACKAC